MTYRPYHNVPCALCSKPTPAGGHLTPFCFDCHAKWEASPEYRRMVTARQDFITRSKKEKGH